MQQGFVASFEAIDTGKVLIKSYDEFMFSHYHFTDTVGSVDYPAMIGKEKYSPYEIVTITVSNYRNHTITLNRVNLEDALNNNITSVCSYDSLTGLAYYPQDFSRFHRHGNPLLDYR